MTSINYQGENVTNLREHLQQVEEISSSDFQNILEVSGDILQRCSRGQSESKKGLIYGHIQSGKTAVIITTMALAADNGYINFIVMTSNLNDIYDQTIDRIKSSLDRFQVFGKHEFKKMKNGSLHPSSQDPSVLVASKHKETLKNVQQIIQNLGWQNKLVMIIDDEADQASLDTNINDQRKPPSAIYQEIVKLREFLTSHDYLQTTATPGALLLQDEDSHFKPDFVVTTIEGDGYVGGKYFFGEENNEAENPHLYIVPDGDMEALTNSKQLPDSVKKSIMVFLLGAAILRMQGRQERYTYLLHTSHKQFDHLVEERAVNHFIDNELKKAFQEGTFQNMPPQLILKEAYTELGKTNISPLPKFEGLLSEVRKKINSTEVVVINASSKQPLKPPTRKHTIYVGGTRLGRGVTIKNLLVTFYGRDANNPQMDTVLQHARMYGYRKNVLPVIRIYLPQRLADRFYDIHRIDDTMREMCRSEHSIIRTIPLTLNMKRITRPNVLNQNTVDLCTYLGGKQYFPHLPISTPDELDNQTEELDELLSKYEEKQVYLVTIDELLKVLNFKFATSSYSDTWVDNLIQQAFSSLQKDDTYENQATLVIVKRDANIYKSKGRGYKEIAAVLPETTRKKLEKEIRTDRPALFMTRTNGKKLPDNPEKGWHGKPFWIPVVRFPNGHYAFTVNRS